MSNSSSFDGFLTLGLYLCLLSRVRSVAQVTGSCGETTVSLHKFFIRDATHCEEDEEILLLVTGENKQILSHSAKEQS